jgi:hypothetical protein
MVLPFHSIAEQLPIDSSWIKTSLQYVGIPGTMALLALFAYHRGWFAAGREVKSTEEHYKRQLRIQQAHYKRQLYELSREHREKVEIIVGECSKADTRWRAVIKERDEMHEREVKLHEQRFLELKIEATESLGRLRTEKDMWRDTTVKGLNIATAAVQEKRAAIEEKNAVVAATGAKP